MKNSTKVNKEGRLQIRVTDDDEQYLQEKCKEARVDKSHFTTLLIRKYSAHLAELLAREEKPKTVTE